MKAWKFPTIEVDDRQLASTVEAVLSGSLKRTVSIQHLKREVNKFASLYPADILSVTLADGQRLSLYLKHLGREESDHPDKSCLEREVRIYEEVLGGVMGDAALPVPRYYGAAWNPHSMHHELYLEYISGWNLKYQDIEHWYAAALNLGRFHAHFARHAGRLRERDFLLSLDRAHFRKWAGKALSAVADKSPELAARLEPIIGDYDRVIAIITGQPATLVHNDLAPKNVLADLNVHPVRICFIDWEMAGVSCGLLDLVHLKYGLDPESDRRMCAAYFEGAAGSGLLPAGEGERSVVLAACALQKCMYRLAHHRYWGLPVEKMAGFVAEAENHYREVAGGAA